MTNIKPSPPRTTFSPSPLGIINTARRAVPAVRYALGVAGVAAAGAVITGLLGNNRATIIILGGMMVAMVLMFIFAKLATAQTPSVTFAGVFLTWSVLLFFCTFLVFTATAVAVGWPVAWSEVLGLKRGGPAPLDQLASRIDYGNVGTNQDAIASLVGMAFVTTDVTEREAIVQLLKHKLAYPETRDYDTPSRLIRKALFEAIIRIRGKDLHADFANGELQNSDLVGIDLHGVNLQGTELNGSFLISTDFRTSNLRSANFTRAFLRNAFFTNADLRGAIFMDCDWFNAAGFTPEQMRDVDPKGLKRCPKASDGTYSKEAFIKKADGLYTISYSDWADEEQAEAARYCRVDGDVAIPIPHRAGRADFPHPVLHERASLAAA